MVMLSSRMPVGGTLGRRSRFAIDLNCLDGPDELGRIVARTGEVLSLTRGGTAGAARVMDANGLWYPVGVQQPRWQHRYNPTTGLYDLAGLFHEGQRINSALGSCSFADSTWWGNSAQFTLAAARSCIVGQTAYRHTWISGTTWRSQTIGTFVNGQTDCAWKIVERADATTSTVLIWDNTVGAVAASVTLNWATRTLSTGGVPANYGAIHLAEVGPNGGPLYLLWVTFTGTAAGTGANGNGLRHANYPQAVAGETKSAILHHAQFEANAKFPSSPIVTAGATVTRNGEVITLPFGLRAVSLTALADFYDFGTFANNTNPAHLWEVSDAGRNPARMGVLNGTTGRLDSYQNPGTGSVFSTPTPTPAYGNRVKSRTVLKADGSVLAGVSVDGGAEVTAAASAAVGLAPSGDWSAAQCYIGHHPTSATRAGFAALRALRFALAEQTLAYMDAG